MAGSATIAGSMQTYPQTLQGWLEHCERLHAKNIDMGLARVGEVARLMTDAGLIVLTAFISPFRSERRMVRDLMAAGEFLEVFVNTPLEVAEARDVKGLYKKARSGALKNFTGIDSPYEAPEAAEITVNTVDLTAEEAAERIVEAILAR